jgi:hypothetical protein
MLETGRQVLKKVLLGLLFLVLSAAALLLLFAEIATIVLLTTVVGWAPPFKQAGLAVVLAILILLACFIVLLHAVTRALR